MTKTPRAEILGRPQQRPPTTERRDDRWRRTRTAMAAVAAVGIVAGLVVAIFVASAATRLQGMDVAQARGLVPLDAPAPIPEGIDPATLTGEPELPEGIPPTEELAPTSYDGAHADIGSVAAAAVTVDGYTVSTTVVTSVTDMTAEVQLVGSRPSGPPLTTPDLADDTPLENTEISVPFAGAPTAVSTSQILTVTLSGGSGRWQVVSIVDTTPEIPK